MATKILVKRTRSAIGRDQRTRRTLKALGLGRIGAAREYTNSTSLQGMLRAVEHLIEVSKA